MVTVHIPDGFLNLPTAAITSGLSLGSLIPAIRKVNQTLLPRRIPLIGMSAAFVFTVQLLSFPVPGGTSVHITGAVLIAILLGPYTGLVIMTSALILQALLFQHGGLLTLGANVLNMGVIGCIIGYYLYRFFFRKYTIGAGIVAWIVIIMSGLCCALELGLSGTIPLHIGLPAMGTAALITGGVEAFVTISILNIIKAIRPDLLMLEKV